LAAVLLLCFAGSVVAFLLLRERDQAPPADPDLVATPGPDEQERLNAPLHRLADEGRAREAYNLFPDARQGFRRLAFLLLAKSRLEALWELAAAHRAKDPDDPLLHLYLGHLYL